MKTLQEIFNTVIAAGFYRGNVNICPTSSFMCISIELAKNAGVIEYGEYHKALKAIANYVYKLLEDTRISHTVTPIELSLESVLNLSEVRTYKDNLAIYMDWKNRPYVRTN